MIVYISLVDSVFRSQQQVANIRKTWEEEDEEALRQQLLSEEESTVKSQWIYISKKVSDMLTFLLQIWFPLLLLLLHSLIY